MVPRFARIMAVKAMYYEAITLMRDLRRAYDLYFGCLFCTGAESAAFADI